MRKFLIKTLVLLMAAGGSFFWLRSDASVLAGAAAFGMDDASGFLAANSQNPAAFNLLESAQAGYVRVELPFQEVSPASGTYVWAYQGNNGYNDFNQLLEKLDRRGIHPVVVFSGGPAYANHLYPQQPVFREELLDAWTSYLRAAVQQFGSRVDYWQVGGVINDPQDWGTVVFPGAQAPISAPDPSLYADMLKIAYSVIKSAQSADTVLLGGLAFNNECAFHPLAYLQALSDLDAWYAFDAISLELPALDSLPETVQVDTCGYLPVQTTGFPLADAVRSVVDFTQNRATKPVWVHGLSLTPDLLATSAQEHGSLPEVFESDYLTRAAAILLADGGADRIFWRYDPLSGVPGAIAMQSFANLSQSLGGSFESNGAYLSNGSLQAKRFRGSGKLTMIAWRPTDGNEFSAAVIPGFEGYQPHAWSADAGSLKYRDGIELQVDNGGSVALMLSERPVIISGKPADFKGSVTLFLKDSAAQAGRGLKGKLAAVFQAQKAKAAEKVTAWVDEQQQSLMDTIKASFNQWLRKSLGLAKL
jgi:hypothetical protein